jgi:hypothetical protein
MTHEVEAYVRALKERLNLYPLGTQIGISRVMMLAEQVKASFLLPSPDIDSVCDCQNPDGPDGVRHVSMDCQVHNDLPADESAEIATPSRRGRRSRYVPGWRV